MTRSLLWSLLGPLIVLYIIFFGGFVVYLFRGKGTIPITEEKYLKLNIPYAKYLVEYILWLSRPFENFCLRVGITPNMVTLLGSAFSLVSAVCYGTGRFVGAAWALAIGGLMDTIDGHLARRQQRETKSGAFLDSTLDRYTEGAVLLGIATYYRGSAFFHVSLAAMLGSMLVSYAKARGEGLGLNFKGGFLKRSERVFYLFMISMLTPIADLLRSPFTFLPQEYLFKVNLAFLAVGVNLTAFYRIYSIHKSLDRE